jgi:thiol-disulfide isomerase/thioredoxin
MFTVEKLGGDFLNTQQLMGKWTILNWWSTRCAPCISEMPGLNQLVNKYRADDRVQFVAIAEDSKEKLSRFLNKKEFANQQTIGNEATPTIFGEAYPVHIIINPQGEVAYYAVGGGKNTYKYLDEVIEGALN